MLARTLHSLSFLVLALVIFTPLSAVAGGSNPCTGITLPSGITSTGYQDSRSTWHCIGEHWNNRSSLVLLQQQGMLTNYPALAVVPVAVSTSSEGRFDGHMQFAASWAIVPGNGNNPDSSPNFAIMRSGDVLLLNNTFYYGRRFKLVSSRTSLPAGVGEVVPLRDWDTFINWFAATRAGEYALCEISPYAEYHATLNPTPNLCQGAVGYTRPTFASNNGANACNQLSQIRQVQGFVRPVATAPPSFDLVYPPTSMVIPDVRAMRYQMNCLSLSGTSSTFFASNAGVLRIVDSLSYLQVDAAPADQPVNDYLKNFMFGDTYSEGLVYGPGPHVPPLIGAATFEYLSTVLANSQLGPMNLDGTFLESGQMQNTNISAADLTTTYNDYRVPATLPASLTSLPNWR